MIYAMIFETDSASRFRSNDGAVDSAGRFWVEAFVDPEFESPIPAEGVMFRLDNDHTLHVMIEAATIPNGVSWTADDRTMYFTDSPKQKVYAYDFDSANGAITNRRVLIDLAGESYVPDGHAMDVDGNIWQACYYGSRVIRISPEGEITGIIHLPTRNITCPVFVGTELFITSAKESEPEKYPESARNGGNLFKVDVGIKGVPKYKARLR
jgi:sugar lactone lactonase YvrE